MNPTEEVQSRIAPLLAPIPGDRRTGVDARNDPRAELLRDEIRKDEYLKRDWPAVSDAAGGLLVDATKDFVVATCWASAAYETCGLPGLVAGLSLLQGLLAQYWEDMFPPTAKQIQRFNALGNFYEHIGTRLQAVATDPSKDTGARPLGVVTPDDAPWLAAGAAALEALHETAQTRFEPPPRPHLVREQLARLQAALPKPVRPASAAAQAAAGSSPASSSSGPPNTAAAPSHVPSASPPGSPRATDPAASPLVPPASPHAAAASPHVPSASPHGSPHATTPHVPSASPHGSPDATTSSHAHAAGSPAPATGPAGVTPDPAPAALSTRREQPVPAATPDTWAIPAGSEPLDAPPRPPPNASEVPAYLNAVAPNLVRAAHALRRHQPGDPLAYRLLRVAVWLRAAEPAPDARGRAPVDALLPATRNPCEAMLRSGKWLELLDASESALAAPANRFCLDLHRYSAAALAALGHRAAHTALLAELAALLRRMPGLLGLQARDGTPLADPGTRALLSSLADPVSSATSQSPRTADTPSLSSGPTSRPSNTAGTPSLLSGPVPSDPSGASTASPSGHVSSALSSGTRPAAPPPAYVAPPLARPEPGPAPAGLDAALEAARARLAARDVRGALALVHGLAETAASPRDRFAARVGLACLTLEAGLVPVARAQLAALLREADERRLADWEPHLVVRLLDALLTALRHGPTSPDVQPLFDRLSTLDPGAAALHAPTG